MSRGFVEDGVFHCRQWTQSEKNKQEHFPHLSGVDKDTEIINHPGLPWLFGVKIIPSPHSKATLATR